MNQNRILLKILTFAIGLFFMASGVALSVKANLGVSPISCIPYVYSLKLPHTLGQLTIIFNILLIALQMLLLRRNYKLIQLLQLPVVFVFGSFIDLNLYWLSDVKIENYLLQTSFCLLSCILLAVGVFLEVKAGITYLPGEGFVLAIVQTFKKEFGRTKIVVDSAMVFLGIISSFILLYRLEGIREGTVASALLVGYLVRFYGKKFPKIDSWLGNNLLQKHQHQHQPTTGSPKKLVITISREYGSGGHEIGRLIAEKLKIAFYDKNLIQLTAEQSGYTPAYIEKHEQKLSHTLLYDLYQQNYSYVNEQLPPLDVLFLIQSKIIREVANAESCVIVGRCANFILKDNPACFNVFIHANYNYRIKKITEEYAGEKVITLKELEKKDRERTNYCKHYTGKNWKEAINYHLTIDSSVLGSEMTAQMIIQSIEKFFHKQE